MRSEMPSPGSPANRRPRLHPPWPVASQNLPALRLSDRLYPKPVSVGRAEPTYRWRKSLAATAPPSPKHWSEVTRRQSLALRFADLLVNTGCLTCVALRLTLTRGSGPCEEES